MTQLVLAVPVQAFALSRRLDELDQPVPGVSVPLHKGFVDPATVDPVFGRLQSGPPADVGSTIFLFVGFAFVAGFIWLTIWGKRRERRIARTPQYEAMYRQMLSEHWHGQGFGVYLVPTEQLRGPSDQYWQAAVAAVDRFANAQAAVDGSAPGVRQRVRRRIDVGP